MSGDRQVHSLERPTSVGKANRSNSNRRSTNVKYENMTPYKNTSVRKVEICSGRDGHIKICTYEVHRKGEISSIFTNKTISRPKPFLSSRILPRFDIIVMIKLELDGNYVSCVLPVYSSWTRPSQRRRLPAQRSCLAAARRSACTCGQPSSIILRIQYTVHTAIYLCSSAKGRKTRCTMGYVYSSNSVKRHDTKILLNHLDVNT